MKVDIEFDALVEIVRAAGGKVAIPAARYQDGAALGRYETLKVRQQDQHPFARTYEIVQKNPADIIEDLMKGAGITDVNDETKTALADFRDHANQEATSLEEGMAFSTRGIPTVAAFSDRELIRKAYGLLRAVDHFCPMGTVQRITRHKGVIAYAGNKTGLERLITDCEKALTAHFGDPAMRTDPHVARLANVPGPLIITINGGHNVGKTQSAAAIMELFRAAGFPAEWEHVDALNADRVTISARPEPAAVEADDEDDDIG